MKKLLLGFMTLASLNLFAGEDKILFSCFLENEATHEIMKNDQTFVLESNFDGKKEVSLKLKMKSEKYGEISLNGQGLLFRGTDETETIAVTSTILNIARAEIKIANQDHKKITSKLNGKISSTDSLMKIADESFRYGCKLLTK